MPQALPVIKGIGTVAGAVGAVKGLTDGGSSGQTTTTQQVDPQTQAMQQDLYRRSQQIAQQPFIPYTGPMVAGFSPDQLRQFQGTRSIFERGMGYDPTRGLQQMVQDQYTPTIQPVTGFQAPTIETTQAPQFRSLLSADIGAYQSPYQQQVIDTAMQDIQRQADIARGGAQERAIRAGAFGGSRSALLEAESQRPFVEQMARTAANLRQAGFEQAQRAAQADVARQQELGIYGAGQQQQRRMQQATLEQQRQLAGLDIAGRAALSQPQLEMQARAQRAGLLGGLQASQLQNLGLLGGIGAQQQALQQRAIDAQRGEFARALAYPQQQLGLLATGVSGMQPTQTTVTGYQPSGYEKFQAGLGLFNTVEPIFSNLFSASQQQTDSVIPTFVGYG